MPLTEDEWVPLELCFGMALFSSELNRKICRKMASHGLFIPAPGRVWRSAARSQPPLQGRTAEGVVWTSTFTSPYLSPAEGQDLIDSSTSQPCRRTRPYRPSTSQPCIRKEQGHEETGWTRGKTQSHDPCLVSPGGRIASSGPRRPWLEPGLSP
ncbi:unnamed protein product, partial [Coregonus sp. 'balchen']